MNGPSVRRFGAPVGWRRTLSTACTGALLLLAVACGSTDHKGTPATTSRGSATTPTAGAQYAGRGPYEVGYTTLRMPDRAVAVWYPADPSAVRGHRKATYDQRTPLPSDLASVVPDQYNTVVTMEAYAGVAGSKRGPFPVLLFSHGAGAFRLASSELLAGIASWGIVVVSADYVERSVVTHLPGQQPLTLDPSRDRRVMLASLDLVTEASHRRRSVLRGLVDAARIAAAGHSAGGTTAFDALTDERVKVAIGWAPAAPAVPPSDKPTMVIGGVNDIAVTPAALSELEASLSAPKRLVEIDNAGHNSFTDLCVVTERGGGMVKLAIDQGLVPQSTAQVLLNGCEDTALASEKFWPVVQHFTVAQLRASLGIDRHPIGLDRNSTRSFPRVAVRLDADLDARRR